MQSNKYQLILASGSPRRAEFLSWLEIPFEVISSDIDEESDEKSPSKLATELAEKKGKVVRSLLPHSNPLIIAADTVVVLEDKIYGKPTSINEAREFLSELSGRSHKVYTGVSILNKESVFSFCEETIVEFAPISDEMMNNYLKRNESLDKAGAYGIQGPSLTFIRNLQGSYSNVVGLPLARLIIEIKNFLGVAQEDPLSEIFEANLS